MGKYTGSDGVEGSMFNLTTAWSKSLLGRMGYVMRKACSKSKVDVTQYEVLKNEFLLEIQNIVCMDSILTRQLKAMCQFLIGQWKRKGQNELK